MTAIVHVTHEAVQKVGGIGAVLQGLITSSAYAEAIDRTILLGPLPDPHSSEPLGLDGTVVYDNSRAIWSAEIGPALYRIEVSRGVRIVYGRRRVGGSGIAEGGSEVEVVLVDVNSAPDGLDGFKQQLYGRFGLPSNRYDGDWEYERYLRLAEPGYEAVLALLGDVDSRLYIMAHEFMGLGTAFKAILEGDPRVVTVFYAHEAATVRRLVEESPGHDVMFYNVLRAGRESGMGVDDIFGSQDDFFKHALVRRAWHCDGVFAVGDWVAEELRFLGSEFSRREPDLVYNGVEAVEIGLREKRASRRKLAAFSEALLRFRPDYVFSHVSRLVASKALWRDLMVCEHLDRAFFERGRSAVLIVLGTDLGPRDPSSISDMMEEYEWPLVHREGYPDLSPGELVFDGRVRAYNARARALKVLFVNQFGWDRRSCGESMPADMTFQDLRRGCDVEFGQSIYEPFGIAQVEPLSFGSISVISDACGCLGFLDEAAGASEGGGRTIGESATESEGDVGSPGAGPTGFIRAAYTALDSDLDLIGAREIGAQECRRAEVVTSQRVARELLVRLPDSDAAAERLLKAGYATASRMSWERVVEDALLPALRRLDRSRRG